MDRLQEKLAAGDAGSPNQVNKGEPACGPGKRLVNHISLERTFAWMVIVGRLTAVEVRLFDLILRFELERSAAGKRQTSMTLGICSLGDFHEEIVLGHQPDPLVYSLCAGSPFLDSRSSLTRRSPGSAFRRYTFSAPGICKAKPNGLGAPRSERCR